jgi:hypothetical protein
VHLWLDPTAVHSAYSAGILSCQAFLLPGPACPSGKPLMFPYPGHRRMSMLAASVSMAACCLSKGGRPCLLVFTGACPCLLPPHWWVSMPACCFYNGECPFEHFCCLLVRCRSLLYLLRWVSMPPASSLVGVHTCCLLTGVCPCLLPSHWWVTMHAFCF